MKDQVIKQTASLFPIILIGILCCVNKQLYRQWNDNCEVEISPVAPCDTLGHQGGSLQF